MPRLFVALDLPPDIRQELDDLEVGLAGVRWLLSESVHLTLRFIGDVNGSRVPDLHAALRAVSGQPFALTLSGLGVFPPRGEPRILWVGVEASADLKRLRQQIHQRVTNMGIKSERKKWSPHVTVARLGGVPVQRLQEVIAGRALFRTEPFLVDSFSLYSSVLHPDGARHTLEETYWLGGLG